MEAVVGRLGEGDIELRVHADAVSAWKTAEIAKLRGEVVSASKAGLSDEEFLRELQSME
jgi:hypothetical protein